MGGLLPGGFVTCGCTILMKCVVALISGMLQIRVCIGMGQISHRHVEIAAKYNPNAVPDSVLLNITHE